MFSLKNVPAFKKLLTVVAVCLMLVACDEEMVLLSQLSEPDANEIVGVLLIQGMPAKKQVTKDGVSITILEKDMSKAVAVLKSAGLPNKAQQTLGEVFKKEGVISTPLEERARYIYALSQELEYTLSQIDHVIMARVHVVLPERVAPGQPIQPSSAAVFIKHLPQLDPDVIESRVEEMVARSIPGLSRESASKISVSFVESQPAFEQVKWVSLGPYIVQEESAKKLKKTLYINYLLAFLFFVMMLVMTFVRTRVWIVTKIPLLSKIAV